MALQEQLYRFYLLDQQVRGLRSRLDAAQRQQKAQQTRLDQFATQARELGDQLQRAQAAASAAEGQSRDVEVRIAKLREQMNAVRSNKEYQALLVEVNTLKIDKGRMEDVALEHLTKVDELRGRLAEVQAKIEEHKRLVAVAQSHVDAARAEVGQQLDEVTGQRNAVAEGIPPEVRQNFDRLCEEHEGEPMATIIEEDRRRMEYTCGGCYMGIPRERVNALLSRRADLVTCPSCGRYLYVDESTKATMAST